jgi:hypothetical protein
MNVCPFFQFYLLFCVKFDVENLDIMLLSIFKVIENWCLGRYRTAFKRVIENLCVFSTILIRFK